MLILITFVMLLVGCASKRSGVYHQVEKGETLYRISKAYDVKMKSIVRANNMRSAGMIREGQFLWVPGSNRKVRRSKTISTKPTVSVGRSKQKTLTRQQYAARRLKKMSLKGAFVWPVTDFKLQKVAKGFGVEGKKKYDGVDIKAPKGTPVVAALGGQVVFAGQGVKGFGKTIIVRHKDEIFSIYSYLDKFDVNKGDSVNRGQIIAKVGRPPLSVGIAPRLHFQIREQATPVNPEILLP